MRVSIEDAVFGDVNNRQKLVQLLIFAYEGRHSVLTIPLAEMTESGIKLPNLAGAWLESNASLDKEAWSMAFKWSIEDEALAPPKKEIQIIQGESNWGKSVPNLSINDAVNVLSRPLSILVENNINDRNFVLVCARNEWKKKIIEAENKSWLSFAHGGGGDMSPQIREMSLTPLASNRCFALFDSDALRPGVISAAANKKINLCTAANIPHHCLKRRAIENYIPCPKLKQWAYKEPTRHLEMQKRQRRVLPFVNLSEAQRHHFNLKRGFLGDARHADRTPEVDVLYATLATAVRSALDEGIDPGIAPDTFGEGIVEDWLISDNQTAETNAFVSKILEVL